MTENTEPSAQVLNERIARRETAEPVVVKATQAAPTTDQRLLRANIAATLALLDEQKRANRMTYMQMSHGASRDNLAAIKAEMDANDEHLAQR